MCDTLVAMGKWTVDGAVLFAKNSDREPNEAQVLTYVPRQVFNDGETVKCTTIEIPQELSTHAVLLCRPFWMWGAEMGINEYGVTIGNEAVFTKEPKNKDGGLLGMDLIRLGLERASTAKEALDVIVHLLETYGQGGNGGFTHQLLYHNSFIIADPREAWVLETAGDYWAAVQVHDTYSISNGLTIGDKFDLASPGLIEHAVKKGWCRNKTEFDFARCYSDFLYTRLGGCRVRQTRSSTLLSHAQGALTPASMMSYLRDHGGAGSDSHWHPAPGGLQTLCVHAGFGPTRDSQSVGSLVAHLDGGLNTAWVTGTSAPCTGLFKPVWLQAGLSDLGPTPEGTFNSETMWWKHEMLHRAVLQDYQSRMAVFKSARVTIEKELMDGVVELANATPEVLRAYSENCFQRAASFTEDTIPLVKSVPARDRLPPFYQLSWRNFNQQAQFPG